MGLRCGSKAALRFVWCGVCRTWPFVRGTWRLTGSPFARWLVVGMDESRLTRLRDGSCLYVVPADVDGRIVYLSGDQDRSISIVCRSLLPEGATVVDVGANCGVVSHCCARAVGPEGVVHAFEPQGHLADGIRASAAVNGLANIVVHSMALSDTDATMELFVPTGHSGGASLEGRRHSAGGMRTVQVAESDTYLESLGLSEIRLLKIDVEGHEASVIRGMRQFFGRHAVDFVLFESLGAIAPNSPDSAGSLLMELGYSVYGVVKTMTGVVLVPAEVLAPEVVEDYLAVRAGLRLADELHRPTGRVPWWWRVRVRESAEGGQASLARNADSSQET